jgi:4-amino-4-deoxy-L-arabinose transferase-like glycosyltransferase
VPVYLLGERWFGRRAAVLAAWISAVYPLRIFFEGELLAVTLFSFFVAWGVWFLWRGLEGGGGLQFFLSGLILGLGALTRPNLLIALPLVALSALVVRGRRDGLLRDGLWFGTALLLALLPATLHNWRAERTFIPVAGNGGINFYLGNRPGASGETPLPPGLKWQDRVQEPIRMGKTSRGDQDRYWWDLAGEALSADPGGWTALLFRKSALFWNAHESSNNKSLPHFTGFSLPVRHYRGWFGVLICLFCAALFVVPLRRGPLLAAGLVCGIWLAVALFFVTARYRIPMVPFLSLFAAAAVLNVARRGLSDRRLSAAGAAAILAAVVVFPGWFLGDGDRIDPDFQFGQIHLSRGELLKAERYLERAEGKNRNNPDVLNSLGAVRFLEEDLRGAEEKYLAALESGAFSEVYFNLGVVYETMDPPRHRRALESYLRALERNPLAEGPREGIGRLSTLPDR